MATLDPKAVLDNRRSGRPSIGLIIGVAVCSACAILALLVDVYQGGPVPTIIGLFLAVLPVPLLIAGVLFLDRLEPEPRRTIVFAFLWGAGVAALLALVINTAGLAFLTVPLFGPQAGYYVSATFGAPLVEETLKGLVLIGILWFSRQELDGPTDGVIYAAMVGLGFALTENVTYYVRALESGTLVMTFVMRGLISPLAHPLFTAMIGLGVAYAAQRHGPARFWGPALGWVAACVLHGIWNGSSRWGLAGLAVAYGLLLLVAIALIVVVVRDRKRIVATIARFLPQYQPTGLVTPEDVRMLATLGGRRQARHWARITGGLRATQAMSDYQLAATELALMHARAERGVAESHWPRRRDQLLALMNAARTAFLIRRPHPPNPPWAGGGAHSGFIRQGPNPPGPGPYQGHPPQGPGPRY
ncbi:MAG: PrsW family intramembrane metalloprotease [Streptosporangiales bacterium]|nr:PrsW family intramembrane metalloprotease [Streptosporangiales bacterium]